MIVYICTFWSSEIGPQIPTPLMVSTTPDTPLRNVVNAFMHQIRTCNDFTPYLNTMVPKTITGIHPDTTKIPDDQVAILKNLITLALRASLAPTP